MPRRQRKKRKKDVWRIRVFQVSLCRPLCLAFLVDLFLYYMDLARVMCILIIPILFLVGENNGWVSDRLVDVMLAENSLAEKHEQALTAHQVLRIKLEKSKEKLEAMRVRNRQLEQSEKELNAMRGCHEELHRKVATLHAEYERAREELVELNDENRVMGVQLNLLLDKERKETHEMATLKVYARV